MKLTQEEKRIKIAEACGWRKCHAPGALGLLVGVPPKSYSDRHNETPYQISGKGPWHEIPDYFNDLNAIYGAWESLTDDQKTVFASHIRRLHDSLDVRIFAAFKRHGVECIGQTLNLWEAGQ